MGDLPRMLQLQGYDNTHRASRQNPSSARTPMLLCYLIGPLLWQTLRSIPTKVQRRYGLLQIRKMTEEFVKAVEPAVSRRLTLTAGSQPEIIEKMFSSQPVNEVPMTQPDRGAYGSRSVQQAKKKVKKARTAGFK